MRTCWDFIISAVCFCCSRLACPVSRQVEPAAESLIDSPVESASTDSDGSNYRFSSLVELLMDESGLSHEGLMVSTPTTTTRAPGASMMAFSDRPGLVVKFKTWGPGVPQPLWVKELTQHRELMNLDPLVRFWARDQVHMDRANIMSIPLLDYRVEFVRLDSGELAYVTLGTPIARRFTSTIYRISEDSTKVFKYQVNCDALLGVHPLLYDYWFLLHLQEMNLVPRVHAISPAVKFEMQRTAKTDFLLAGPEREICAAHPKSSVRYMIMDRIPMDLHEAGQKSSYSIGEVLNIMRIIVYQLERLHSRGIVHGDIHGGNVVYLDNDRAELGFIDFGLSFFAEHMTNYPDKVREPLSHVHCLYSPYELEGFRPSYRDDVFRAIEIGAYLLNTRHFMTYCTALEENGAEMMRFKSEDFMFWIPGNSDPFVSLDSLPVGKRVEFHERLQRVLDLVRNVHEIDSMPPYADIMAELLAARALAP